MLETQATTDTNETQAPAMPVYKWTVLVYLAGDNNLSAEMIYGLLEMKAGLAGSNGDVAVVAQLHPPGEVLPTQRYVINGNKGQAVYEPAVAAGEPAPFKANANSLPADALLAKKEVKDHERRILPEMLDLVVKHGEEIPTLAATVSPRTPKQLAKFAVKLKEKSKISTAEFDIVSKEAKTKDDLLPAFQDASLTDDTGNPWTLLRFLFWGVDNFPAEKYMVVLSGHGSGAVGDFLRDDSSGGSLTVAGLGEAFALFSKKLGKPLDILGLDSCLMSMAEVYCELAESVKFVVGAEGFEPNTGWPYRQVFAPLVTNSEIAPGEYAKTIVDNYAEYYFDYSLGGVSVDLAACNCEPKIVEGLTDRVRDLSGYLIRALRRKNRNSDLLKDAVLLAHWNAQTYKFDQYVDLRDFCDLLSKRNIKGVIPYCESIVKFIDESVVLKSCYSGPAFQYSHGLSIYFPWATCSDDYLGLKFADATRWGEFLKLFIGEEAGTRRPPRQARRAVSPVLEKVFNPCPNSANSPRVSSPSTGKADDPCKHASMKFTRPCDRGEGERATGLKNPAIRWCPLCSRNGK